jgi:hypothetical protein
VRRRDECSADFEELGRPPFLTAIRRHPAVLIHGEVGCSLVHNAGILKQIAVETGAGGKS